MIRVVYIVGRSRLHTTILDFAFYKDVCFSRYDKGNFSSIWWNAENDGPEIPDWHVVLSDGTLPSAYESVNAEDGLEEHGANRVVTCVHRYCCLDIRCLGKRDNIRLAFDSI